MAGGGPSPGVSRIVSGHGVGEGRDVDVALGSAVATGRGARVAGRLIAGRGLGLTNGGGNTVSGAGAQAANHRAMMRVTAINRRTRSNPDEDGCEFGRNQR